MTKATPRAGRRTHHPARAADHGDGTKPTSGRRPPRQPPRSVTISSIAESAGVSVPTVSKVINGRSGVSADTRARVEAVINEYGYRRPEPSKRRDLMELVFPELDHMWGLDIIRGVERVARQHGMGLVLSEFGPQRTAGRDWIDDASSRRPACVVAVGQLSAAQRDQLRARDIPFVILDPSVELPADVAFVGATNWSGGRTATRHLVELGHRRIAMIGGPDGVLRCRARLDGYRAALEAAGLSFDADLVVRAEVTQDAGYEAARELLSRRRRPTAIFACGDVQALGAYRAARESRVAIPDELSVVGFDDHPIVALADPPMTTVHQPLREMARAATELALALGRGDTPRQIGLELATTLAVRHSTAAPADSGRPV